MGFFDDKSGEAYDRAIANVKDLGDKASKHDREMAKTASRQAGERGNRARDALGRH